MERRIGGIVVPIAAETFVRLKYAAAGQSMSDSYGSGDLKKVSVKSFD